ncbi:hypothetical protein NIES4074_47240 [Cylindrospermum sp. NIES-4074]|nr:hypothetical protein NIES4074_47240 [Cylindrospermum sp. NIES-4074]
MNELSLVLLSLALVAFQACGLSFNTTNLKLGKDKISPPVQQQRNFPMINFATTIEAKGTNTWLIRVERQFQGESAVGEVIVKQEIAPNQENPPHIELAGSRAWLALGERRLAVKDIAAAISCAQAGLDELGSDYASPLIVDDTKMKLLIAEERIQEGHAEDGAKIMLRMLNTRTELYRNLHKSSIVE